MMIHVVEYPIVAIVKVLHLEVDENVVWLILVDDGCLSYET